MMVALIVGSDRQSEIDLALLHRLRSLHMMKMLLVMMMMMTGMKSGPSASLSAAAGMFGILKGPPHPS